MSNFLKIYYQKTEDKDNEIKSLEVKSSDFDCGLLINIVNVISIYYNILERILEINVVDDHSYVFVNTSYQTYQTLIHYLE